MGTFQEIRKKFQALIGKGKTFNTTNHMATETGIEQKSLERFLKGEGGLTLKSTAKVFDTLGVKIVFPGEDHPTANLTTPEAVRLDELIVGMRKMNMTPEAIRDAVITELSSMFQKNSPSADTEERRRAS